jgi:hypothetical protein
LICTIRLPFFEKKNEHLHRLALGTLLLAGVINVLGTCKLFRDIKDSEPDEQEKNEDNKDE